RQILALGELELLGSDDDHRRNLLVGDQRSAGGGVDDGAERYAAVRGIVGECRDRDEGEQRQGAAETWRKFHVVSPCTARPLCETLRKRRLGREEGEGSGWRDPRTPPTAMPDLGEDSLLRAG